MIRTFTIKDYDKVIDLWKKTPGVGLRSMDIKREGMLWFFVRNPNSNFVTVNQDKIIGAVLSGHDGRRGDIYHICVEKVHRQKSIGRQLMKYVTDAMKEEKITKLALVRFTKNGLENDFREPWDGRYGLI